MNRFLKEALILSLIALPYVYLVAVWEELPLRVPIHFNIEGVADDWTEKSTFLYLPAVMGLGVYFLMLLIPLFDPKKKIQQMGEKYYSFRLMLSLFISLITLFIIYAGKEEALTSPQLLLAIIGAFMAMLGNYFQTLRPNYFIGIRTPWTLENEHVWKKTHHLAGRLWMIGGILIVLLTIIMKNPEYLIYGFASIISVMVLVPIVFSFIEYRKQKNSLS